MKIFRTQLQGLITNIDEFEEQFEEASRVIAQSIISDGELWIYGEKEMQGIVAQATEGDDPFPTVRIASERTAFSELDTLIVCSTDPYSEQTKKIVEKARESGCQIIGISSHDTTLKEQNRSSWTDACQFYFSTGVKQGLVPTEEGNRIGTPHLLIALHIYYALYFTLQEYLEEFEM
ncbi:DUF2529 family protein [Evansella halocellulosilytica]|uniref:DUF2529 family protein n=1 Tax=Evansella halocellulosilytica TaxID=2011013 RepID=UPI000BB87BC3|nr:DUF2529 family protein [Evansella halocellulosilytica]